MNTNETDPQLVDFVVAPDHNDILPDLIDTPPQLSAEQVAQFMVDILSQSID